jgi:Thrombospondin type 3 repeat/Calcineurin-like phosphoesterase
MWRIALLLTAAIGTAALLAFFYPNIMVNAAEVATRVEGENFATKPAGYSVISGAGYSGGAALKFTQNNTASHTVNCSVTCDVVLMASGGQTGGQPTFSVNGSPAQALTSTSVRAYTFDVNLAAGSKTINVTAGNTGTGRNAVLDVVTFPASDGGATDTTPPNVTIDSGPGDTSDGAATFTFSSDEPATFECKLLQGTTTISNWAACTSPKTYPGLADGDYRFQVRGKDPSNNVSVIRSKDFTVTNGGGDGDADGDGVPDSSDNCPNVYNPGQRDDDGDGVGNKCDTGSTPPTDTDGDGVSDSSDNCPKVANPNQADSDGDGIGDACETQTSGSAILVGAGDISSGGSRDQDTGDLVRAQLNGGAWGVFTTGDNAYPDGTYQNYQVYDAAWGSFRSKTRPTYGNHDYYGSSTAVGAEQYWNEGLDPTPVRVSNAGSYYAYDVGNSNWRAIVLNSVSTEGPSSNQAPSCAAGSPQMTFLSNALNTTKNTVLFWHHARFSASTDHPTSEGATGCSKTFFDAAYDNGADLVMQGHSHLYERYDTRDKTGAKVAGGLTSIVCGLGGNSSDGLQGGPSPAYDRAFTNAWGVCKLTLNTSNAQVQFLPAPGSPGTDSVTVAVRP